MLDSENITRSDALHGKQDEQVDWYIIPKNYRFYLFKVGVVLK